MRKRAHSALKWLKQLGFKRLAALAAGICLIILGIVAVWVSTLKLPTVDSFGESERLAESTKIYDRTGQIVLYDVVGKAKRTVVDFDKISQNAKNATIAIEDKDFYSHQGFKLSSFIRAIFANVSDLEFSQGGSTITQQVIKNTVLTGIKSPVRKLKEIILALKLDGMLEKDEILGLYLNVIPYGGNMYGIEEASLEFFGKHASELTVSEAAYIAAIPQAPTYYSPYGSHRDKLDERKNLVLEKMREYGYLNDEELAAAKAEKVTFLPQEDGGIKAPHFVMYVKEYLAEKYGEEALERGGLKVITTLDYDLQKKAEEIAKKYALSNKKTFDAENAAFVAIDPHTGQILTMVGSRDYFDKEIDGNFNVAIAPNRQPGSTFKPFAYAEAFLKGYTPETALFDVQTQFSTACAPDDMRTGDNCYAPVNYDGVYRGPITMRNALAQSINVPSVKTVYLAGLKDTLNLAKDMGIGSLKEAGQYGLTLVLGGGEVSLLDMTSAYSVFANSGARNPHAFILQVQDRTDAELEKFEQKEVRVLPENVALQVNDVLSDNEARAPAFGSNSALFFPGLKVAVKTGTTNDYRDAWIIGYTPNVVIGAWAGNNDNRAMQKKVAGFIVAPMWHELMTEALKTYPADDFKPPIYDYSNLKPVLRGQWQGGESYTTDKASGLLATEFTPQEMREEHFTGGIHTILYWVNKDDPRGPAPANPQSDPQFNNWEYAVQVWAEAGGYANMGSTTPPTEFDNIHTAGSGPRISFSNPEDGESYDPDDRILVRIDYSSDRPVKRVEYYLNDRFIGGSDSSPYNFSFTPNDFDFIEKKNALRAVAIDELSNKGEAVIDFTLENGRRSDFDILNLIQS